MTAEDGERGEDRKRAQDSNEPAPPGKKPSLLKHILMIALTLAIVMVVFFYVLPRFASYKSVFQAMGELSIWQLALLFAVAIFNLACAWTMNQASLPGMRNWQAAQLTLSQNLIASTLPLGGAWSVGLGYTIIHSYGFGVADYSLMLGVSGIWNTFAKLALPVVALLLLLVTGNTTAGMATLALIALVFLIVAMAVFVVILWKRSFARRVGDLAGNTVSRFLRLFHRGPVTTWGEGLAWFRDRTVSVTKSRWPVLTLVAVTYQVSTFLVYLLALRFSGVPAHGDHGVSWVVAFGVFAFVRLISAIPITPGAVGIAEASYISLLVAAGGSEPEVVAGVLLFRGLTWLMPIALGLPAYAAWWLSERKVKKSGRLEGAVIDSLAEEEA
ncbi:MAG: YbhN family protein [Actinobacteria bacterium]|nr:YbhN family protein [Actinomycetota bacterium]MCG2817748.1 YbhN family protein [Actinomycetes bacterium]MBU4217903.1 YbhN family protein [Actinomycetota bacterium]MBU4360017.1 YbhN family protein [Actinomycetota bacterium]MBU4390964.1 YbhN family protein [Actinomycetota bacterium]